MAASMLNPAPNLSYLALAQCHTSEKHIGNWCLFGPWAAVFEVFVTFHGPQGNTTKDHWYRLENERNESIEIREHLHKPGDH